jgi:hypothetical protein
MPQWSKVLGDFFYHKVADSIPAWVNHGETIAKKGPGSNPCRVENNTPFSENVF